MWFRIGYNEQIPASMVEEGKTEVPFEGAESLLVPGSPGTVFVALRPDNTTVNVNLLAKAIIEEADKTGAEGWTKTKHTQRIIPCEMIAPETDLEQLARKIVNKHFLDSPSHPSTFRYGFVRVYKNGHLFRLALLATFLTLFLTQQSALRGTHPSIAHE